MVLTIQKRRNATQVLVCVSSKMVRRETEADKSTCLSFITQPPKRFKAGQLTQTDQMLGQKVSMWSKASHMEGGVADHILSVNIAALNGQFIAQTYSERHVAFISPMEVAYMMNDAVQKRVLGLAVLPSN